MRLYLDENLSPRVAELLRARDIDATGAYEEGNVGLDDRGQLRHAIQAGRTIVTADIADFMALADELMAANTSHAGMLLVPGAFRLSESAALADAVAQVAGRYPEGAPDTVLVLGHRG